MSSASIQQLMNRQKKIHEALKQDNKKVLNKLCAQLQKDYPDSPYTKITMSEVYYQQERYAEAEKLLNEVKNLKACTTDDALYSRTQGLLKKLGKWDDMVTLCRQAWQAHIDDDPSTSILYAHELFAALIKQGDLNQQKKFAMELFMKFKNEKYFLWNAVITTFQAAQAEPPHATMFNTLSLQFFQKHFGQTKEPTQQQLLFYIANLTNQGKFQDAVNILEGELGINTIKVDFQRLEIIARLYLRLENWEKATNIYNDLIMNKEPKNWEWFKNLIECTLKRYQNEKEVIEQTKKIFNQLKEKDPADRSPLLAECELEYRLLSQDPNHSDSHLISLLGDYFNCFGTKPCFFRDIKIYTAAIKSKNELLEKFKLEGDKNKGYFEKVINTSQVRRYLSSTEVDPMKEANSLFQLYEESNLLPSETQRQKVELAIGDCFVLLAAHYLLDKWASQVKSNPNDINTSLIINAILILEYGLKRSPYNHQIKLLLVILYNAIGVLTRTFDLWDTMDIKHIQMDTLSYLWIDSSILYFETSQSQKAFKELIKFHSDLEVKISDNVMEAYKNGSYEMINDFIQFRRKLDDSIVLAIAQTESVISNVYLRCNTIDDVSKLLDGKLTKLSITEAKLKSLIDNSDWNVVDRWDKTSESWQTVLEETFNKVYFRINQNPNKQLQTLKLKNLYLVYLSSLSSKTIQSSFFDEIRKALGDLSFLESSIELSQLTDEKIKEKKNDALQAVTILVSIYIANFVFESSKDLKSEGSIDFAKLQTKLSGLTTHLSVLTKLVNIIQERTNGTKNNVLKIQLIIQFAQSLFYISLVPQIASAELPKRAKKNTSVEEKEMQNQFKEQMKLLLQLVKENFEKLQTQVETEVSTSYKHFDNEDFVSFSSQEDVTNIKSKIEDFLAAAKKLNTMRLLEFIKDKLIHLKTIKFN